VPELPEVETIRRDLYQVLRHKTILKLDVNKTKQVRGDIESFTRVLEGNSFSNIERRGKLLIFTLSNTDTFLLTHLKMTGQLIYQDGEKVIAGGHSHAQSELNFALPNKYTHIIFTFDDGSRLFFNDMRQFGYLQLVDLPGKTAIESNYGLEPLSEAFELEYFQAQIKRYMRATIKKLLLDQQAIAGIGNIYADEICFQAKVRPDRLVTSLTEAEIVQLYDSIKPLLLLAIKHRGTTFNDYRDARGNKGNFVRLLKVYGRAGQQCSRCERAKIEKIKHAGRGTHFCPQCQV